MSVLLLSDSAMGLHDPGPGHPERPARMQAIEQAMQGWPAESVQPAAPQPADRNSILRVHTPAYMDSIDGLRGTSARLDADTAVSQHSVAAAYLAAGAAIDAVDFVCAEKGRSAFALVRPPGHHAERDRAMGFCLFNNIAIAAAHAIETHRLTRVLIIDWDVHHGNGTQHVFEHRDDVLFFSSHQWPLYPGSGALNEIGFGAGEGFTINAPLPAGFDDAAHLGLYRRLLVPIAHAYKPELVLVSAGFDSHQQDPLGGMMMTEHGFAALCALARDIADMHAQGRLALILEGGYSIAALSSSIRACIHVLRGEQPPVIDQACSSEFQPVIDRICAHHRARWREVE